MKEILKNVKMNFKLNSTVFILASVIYLFLLVIGLSLTLIFPFSDVLTVIFIISPFIFTFSYLAYKSSEREILEYKDVYKGYKEVFVSFSYIFKRLVKPLFFSLLIGIGAYFVLCTLDLMIIDYEFYKEFTKVSISQDIEAMNNMITQYPETMNRLMICIYITIGVMIIAFNLFANKKILSYIFYLKIKKPFINYDFLIRINQEHYKYKTFWLDLLFALSNIIGLVLAIILSELLLPILDNTSIVFLITIFIYFLFVVIIMPFKYLMYSEIFNKSFTEEITKLKETYNNN